MNCCWQTSEGVKLGKAKNKNLLELWYIGIKHSLSQCKKAGRKLAVLVRICNFMTIECIRMLMKAFIESQFGYCPLVWMCCNRSSNNRINHLHERALGIVYNDNVSSFEDLLQRDQSVRTVEVIELYKTKTNISGHIMNDLFEQQDIIYNLRSQTDFRTGLISTVNSRLKSLRYLGPKIGNITPPDIRNSGNIEGFTRKIKCWTSKDFPCRP